MQFNVKSVLGACCAGVLSMSLAGAASADIGYDTLGFEVPSSGFTYVQLEGQAGGSPSRLWRAIQGTNQDPVVTPGVGVGGTDGVQFEVVDGPTTFDYGEVGTFGSSLGIGGEAPTAPVVINLDLSVVNGAVGSTPFFGFSAFGGTTTPAVGSPRIATILVDSDSGALLVNDGGSGGGTISAGTVTLNAYHNYNLVLDFTTKTYELEVDGTSRGTFDFSSETTGVRDANGKAELFSGLNFLGLESGAASTTVASLAFYDNLTIAVPEPTSLALIGLGGLAMLRRRR